MTNQEPDWNSVSPGAFEELCAELLAREGFVNVGVMSGPGGKDLGRDIHAEELVTLRTGETRTERILVQCKNRASKRAISTQEAAWYAERAKTLGYTRLLIITSSDLSSSAKLYLENCNKSSQGIHISYWNQNKLVDLLTKHENIFAKYVVDPFKRLLAQQSSAKRERPFLRFPLVAVAGHSHVDSLFGSLAIPDTSISSIPNSKAISIGKIVHAIRPLLDRMSQWDFVDSLYLPGLVTLEATEATFGELGAKIDLTVLTVNEQTGIDPEIVRYLVALKKHLIPFVIALMIPKESKLQSHELYSERGGDLRLEYIDRREFERAGIEQQIDDMTWRVATVLKRLGFSASAFYDITDFTRTVAIAPIFQSRVQPKAGLNELLLLLTGLITAYLGKELFSEP